MLEPAEKISLTVRQPAGFSLIELMIVVAVIGILAAVAVPTYMDYRREGFKTEAKTNLTNLAMLLEEYRSLHDTYCPPVASGGCGTYRYVERSDGNVSTNTIAWVDFHPKQATSAKAVRYSYEAQVDNRIIPPGVVPTPTYILTAVPETDRGAAPGDLTLDQDGAKTDDGQPGWPR